MVTRTMERTPSLREVMFVELRCIVRTLVMLVTCKVKMPGGQVGRRVTFADGSTSRIYRERRRPPRVFSMRFSSW